MRISLWMAAGFFRSQVHLCVLKRESAVKSVCKQRQEKSLHIRRESFEQQWEGGTHGSKAFRYTPAIGNHSSFTRGQRASMHNCKRNVSPLSHSRGAEAAFIVSKSNTRSSRRTNIAVEIKRFGYVRKCVLLLPSSQQ